MTLFERPLVQDFSQEPTAALVVIAKDAVGEGLRQHAEAEHCSIPEQSQDRRATGNAALHKALNATHELTTRFLTGNTTPAPQKQAALVFFFGLGLGLSVGLALRALVD